VDVSSIFNALLTGVTSLTYVGKEALGDTSTYQVRGTVGPDVLALFHPAGGVPSDSGVVEMWIGTRDFLVRQLRLTQGQDTATLVVSRFDEASVTAPLNPRAAEELRALIAPPTQRPGPYGLPTTPEGVKAFIQGLPQSSRECGRKAVGDTAFEELAAGARMPTSDEIQTVLSCFGY
jgi:hypothetical protein